MTSQGFTNVVVRCRRFLAGAVGSHRFPTRTAWNDGAPTSTIARAEAARLGMRRFLAGAVLIGLACSGQAIAATLFVKTAGTGTANCLSWANACTLTQASSTAASGDQVWVKAGAYAGPIYLANNVKMIGGFAGAETQASQSNPTTQVTILDGGNADRVVYSTDHVASTQVRGFTIRNGRDTGDEGGGALWLENSSAVFVHCRFEANSATHFGGVMAVRGASAAHFVNCTFINNGTGSGTGVAPLGGGVVYLYSGMATFTNCLLVGNKAGEGGVMMVMSGNAAFYNCTLVSNDATNGDGGAILDAGGRVRFRNSILWGNTVPSGRSGPQIYFSEGYLPSVKYCDVQGGFTGTANINADPMFLDPGSSNYDIPETSPCKEAGNNSDLPPDVGNLDWDTNATEWIPLDLNRDPRITNGHVDMGAYEGPYVEVPPDE